MSLYTPPAIMDSDRAAEAQAAFDEVERLSHRLEHEVTSGAEVDAVHAELRRAIARLRAANAALGPARTGSPTLLR